MSEKIELLNSVDKSINRLSWRIASKNSFKPNEGDVDALNGIIDWVNRQRSEIIDKNQLYAKLYVYFLHQTIMKFESTIFEPLVQKELSKLLDLPLENFYIAFHKDLHQNQFSFIESVKDLQEIKEKYTLAEVEEKLNIMISESLNKFQ